MPRVLLLLPSTTYRAHDFLEAARKLGVEVVVGTEEPHALGGLMGARALKLPLADPRAAAEVIVASDGATPLDAIVAVDEQATLAAASAALELGLVHNPPSAVAAALDKLAMRRALARSEVQQPAFVAIPADASDEQIASKARSVGLPCVIKPTTLSASQGVVLARSQSELPQVVEQVRRIAADAGVAPGTPLLLEAFVEGPEVAVEGLLRRGTLQVLAVFDKPDPLDGPFFEETIYVTPTRLAARDVEAVTSTTQAAARALRLSEGPVHAELRVRDGRAWVVEIAARTIGGLCSRALSFSTGKTLEELVLANALGMPAEGMEHRALASGVLMIPIPEAGTFLGIDGLAEALAVPGVSDVQVTIPRGREVLPVPFGNRYLGFVFARARRPEDVERALRRARALLEVRIDPVPARASL